MSKRICTFLFALSLIVAVFGGHAETASPQEYTDVPGMPTQDSVCFIQILSGYRSETQAPDEYSMMILDELFPFVYEEKNRPVRYYDEPTQEKIQALIEGADPDALYMSEYMTVLMSEKEDHPYEADNYTFDMFIDVDYQPGQLVVAVIGTDYQDKETIAWHPYLCKVPETGRIDMRIPKEDIEQYEGVPVLLTILTDRFAGRVYEIWTEELIWERIVLPSKTEEELRRVVDFVHHYTKHIPSMLDDFRIFTVPKTEYMDAEIERMRIFLKDAPSLYHYFPEMIQSEIRYLFPTDTDMDGLIAYEIIALQDENYQDTYGDVAVQLEFAVKYSEKQNVAVILGFPKKDTAQTGDLSEWEWTCMRANVMDGNIEAIFEQLMLIRLDEEPGLMLILSDPLPQAGN